MILAFLAAAVSASAQYNTELYRKGGKFYLGEEKLSREQFQTVMSSRYNESGIAYYDLWKKNKGMRDAGIVLTSVGTVSTVAGGFTILIGAIIGVGEGLGQGLSNSLGGGSQTENSEPLKAPGIITGGFVAGGAGVAMLGSGIPLWCVGSTRMKKAVEGYNGPYAQKEPKDVYFTLGPCPNGVGLSFRF